MKVCASMVIGANGLSATFDGVQSPGRKSFDFVVLRKIVPAAQYLNVCRVL